MRVLAVLTGCVLLAVPGAAQEADRVVVRLAVGEVARALGSALDSLSAAGTVWIYHSDPELMRRSRDGHARFLERLDEAGVRALVESGGAPPADAPAELRAWHRGLAYLTGKGMENAARLLRFQAAAAGGGSGRALAEAPPVVEEEIPELHPLVDAGIALPTGAPAVGILDFDSHALNGEAEIIDSLAAALGRRGLRAVPVVARWGELQSAREVEPAERGGADADPDQPDGAGKYRSVGQVYQDTTTGRMFVVEEAR